MQELIQRLAQGHSLYQLSKAYGKIKDGTEPTRPDAYGSTIKRIIAEPDKARWESLKILLLALGVDGEAAIAIAASQVKPPQQKE